MTEPPLGQVSAVLGDNLSNIYNCQYHTTAASSRHHEPGHPQSTHGRLQIRAVDETSQKFS